MKTNVWVTLIAWLATSALAQTATNPPPAPAPAPAATPTATTPAPAAPAAAVAKPGQKRAAKATKMAKAAPAAPKPAPKEKPVFLSPGPATITGDNVNVRGQATIFSEVVTRLHSGDSVKVIEQVIRDNPKAGDVMQWAKIAIPPNVHLWVHSAYIDATNKVVLPKRLNVRTGPGENYSVVGLLEQGAPIKEISTKGNWIEIEAPADACAFVAASYLKQEGAPAALPPVVSIAPPVTEPAPSPATVPEPTPVAKTTTEVPPPTAPAPEPAAPSTAAPAAAPAPETEPAPPPAEEPPPKRVVQHEGIVKGTWSIQAPTKFALVDPVSGKTVNYLYTSSTNLDLRLYKGRHIIVTGEEGLDERWKNTPVITIQRIQVIE
jgi:uncharacterized protein YgiM (DUF1202 family)